MLDPGIQDPRHKIFSEAQIWSIQHEIPFFEAKKPDSEIQVPLSEAQVPCLGYVHHQSSQDSSHLFCIVNLTLVSLQCDGRVF